MGCFPCHSCRIGIELASGDRIGYRETCSACNADLHTCTHCTHHDPSAYNECRESSAERVGDRERANRCDYFEPGASRTGVGDKAEQHAKSALEDLFKKG